MDHTVHIWDLVLNVIQLSRVQLFTAKIQSILKNFWKKLLKTFLIYLVFVGRSSHSFNKSVFYFFKIFALKRLTYLQVNRFGIFGTLNYKQSYLPLSKMFKSSVIWNLLEFNNIEPKLNTQSCAGIHQFFDVTRYFTNKIKEAV